MKYSSDTIGNRTRDLPTCSAVPQPTAPPRAPVQSMTLRFSQEKQPYGSQNKVIISTKNCNKLTQVTYNRIFLRCVRTYFNPLALEMDIK